MWHGPAVIRALLAALTLLLAISVGAPSFAQQPSGRNPTAEAVKEEQLLHALRGGDTISGRVSQPDDKLNILQQPQGRDYRQFHEGWLPWIGGIAILGMIIALAVFYFTRGRIALEDSPESGRKILRFNALERFTHWMTATSFILLAITGLNYFFGKRLLFPLLGPDAFATWSQWAKYIHNFVAWPFMLGLLIMLVVWIKDNIPDRYDVGWIKAGGGFFGRSHPPARRFNAGQKIIFWSVILGGIALSVSGIIMLFPFSAVDINGMQTAQYVHAIVGVILTAIMIAHIYIGSLGMEGAYSAMGSGEVDLAWAKSHHSVWVEEQQAKTASGPQLGRARTAPAE
jgi:formate dehydrogenase subunit gamma